MGGWVGGCVCMTHGFVPGDVLVLISVVRRKISRVVDPAVHLHLKSDAGYALGARVTELLRSTVTQEITHSHHQIAASHHQFCRGSISITKLTLQ